MHSGLDSRGAKTTKRGDEDSERAHPGFWGSLQGVDRCGALTRMSFASTSKGHLISDIKSEKGIERLGTRRGVGLTVTQTDKHLIHHAPLLCSLCMRDGGVSATKRESRRVEHDPMVGDDANFERASERTNRARRRGEEERKDVKSFGKVNAREK
ncbi:hypothetical protein B0H19DRAFT_1057728 [Mycena capillaripes]|nr:hypothetical protein B0H19DRAFT_1057728 [Mycena capillaripes]